MGDSDDVIHANSGIRAASNTVGAKLEVSIRWGESDAGGKCHETELKVKVT